MAQKGWLPEIQLTPFWVQKDLEDKAFAPRVFLLGLPIASNFPHLKFDDLLFNGVCRDEADRLETQVHRKHQSQTKNGGFNMF